MSTSQTEADPTPQKSRTSEASPSRPERHRQSSITFSADTSTTSRSPMSRAWRDSDEITPIRASDGTPGRNYSTVDVDDPSPATVSKKTKPTSNESSAADESKNGGTRWYKRMAEKYGSVSLENKGSVARDHLALERTFLAWLRTSLAFASIGIAITQLFRLNTSSQSRTRSTSRIALVPFSPYIGQTIPAELLPYLQQAAATAVASVPNLGPTLLDQLLMLPPLDGVAPALPQMDPIQGSDFDEHAARRLRHVGKPLGATFLGIAIIVLFIGFHRYFESQHWIIRGKFPASRGSIFLIAFIAGALIIASLIVVLVVAPTSFEKKGIGKVLT